MFDSEDLQNRINAADGPIEVGRVELQSLLNACAHYREALERLADGPTAARYAQQARKALGTE